MSPQQEIDSIKKALDFIKPHRQKARESDWDEELYEALLIATVILDDRKCELEDAMKSAAQEVAA